MTTTIQALPIAMTEAEARQITNRITLLFDSVTDQIEKIKGLIVKAEAGEAWRALDYPSWTAYSSAEFSGCAAGLEKALRGRVIEVLAEAGMSTRAMASITGTSVGTVHNDLTGVQLLNTSTTGIDGKTYERPSILPDGRPSSSAMADIASKVPAVKPKPRRRPLPDQYWDAVYDLSRVVARLERLTADDRFEANAAGIAGGPSGNELHNLRCRLHDRVVAPMVKAAERTDITARRFLEDTDGGGGDD